MKKYFFRYWAVFCLFLPVLLSGQQSTFLPGFRYQAVLRDDASQPLGNKGIMLKVSIIGNNNTQGSYYTETHQIQTDEKGLFGIVIGKGNEQLGSIADLPWANEQLSLRLEMSQEGVSNYSLVSTSSLLAVPYALHAVNAGEILNPFNADGAFEKSGVQSIYWSTSGNLGTNPSVNYIGSSDNVNVVFKTNGKPYLTLTPIGKLQLISDVPAGPDNLKSSYPVVVEGTSNIQGVWVKINGSRAKANNFVTFADDDGIQGRIEGQTLSELEASDSYTTMVEVTSINAAALVGKVAELIAKAIAETAATAGAILICGLTLGSVGCEDIPAEAAGAIACSIKVGAWTVETVSYLAATGTSFDRIRKAVGVSYSSGSGDYAEWLLRKSGERNMVYGEIVGVNGGMVSLNTTLSTKNMVVSKSPAFLGKTPAEGNEDNFEKIAFMGQVPVRVIGKVKSGDYILPSGHNDGLGIAVHPKDLATADYSKIVGVAWETVENDLPFNLVNVAVGIKSSQLASKVDDIDREVNNIINYLDGKGPLHPFLNSADVSTLPSSTVIANGQQASSSSSLAMSDKVFSNEEYDHLLDMGSEYVKKLYGEIEQKLISQGYDLNSNPAIALLFKDPVNALKRMHRNPKEFADWAVKGR